MRKTYKSLSHRKLKPYDKVLVRNNKYDKWFATLFSCFDEEQNAYVCVDGKSYSECVHYSNFPHLYDTTHSIDKPDKKSKGNIEIPEHNTDVMVFLKKYTVGHIYNALLAMNIKEDMYNVENMAINLYEAIESAYRNSPVKDYKKLYLYTYDDKVMFGDGDMKIFPYLKEHCKIIDYDEVVI